jgi:hypothetical protein
MTLKQQKDMKTHILSTDKDVRMKATIVPTRSFTSASHSGATDVGITLRVTNIRLPPPALPGAHEDFWISEVGLHVDVEEKDSSEGRYFKNKERRWWKKETLDCDSLYPSRIWTDLSGHGLIYKGQERIYWITTYTHKINANHSLELRTLASRRNHRSPSATLL